MSQPILVVSLGWCVFRKNIYLYYMFLSRKMIVEIFGRSCIWRIGSSKRVCMCINFYVYMLCHTSYMPIKGDIRLYCSVDVPDC